MSTHKNIDRICVAVIVLTMILTVLFMNGKSLGIQAIADEDAEGYSGTEDFTANDLDGAWDRADATVIALEGTGASISGSGAYVLDGSVYIKNAGKYVLSGKLTDGSIVVDAYRSSKVFLLLDGAEIYCADDAALRVNQADKVFLSLAEGTENSLESGESYSEEALSDNAGGTIFTHDDLSINGSGALEIHGAYKHGIDANDSLVITGGKISIESAEDGIHVNEAFKFTGADLSIAAGDDGIHADESILVDGGTILITECYEGLEALTIDMRDGTVTVYPSDDGFNANGATERGFGGGGFGGGFGGGGRGGRRGGFGNGSDGVQGNGNEDDVQGFGNGSDGTQGSRNEDSAQGNRNVDGAQGFGSRPDSNSTQGNGDTPQDENAGGSREAFQGTDSDTNISSESRNIDNGNTDSGNADAQGQGRPMDAAEGAADKAQQGRAGGDGEGTEEDTDKVETWIHISGGTINIINDSGRDADGLDSNGDILITGGTIRVSLVDTGGNCAIDYGSESGGKCEITGGNLIACGSAAMAEPFDDSSTQCSIFYAMGESAEAGTLLTLEDSDGNVLMEYEVPNSFSAVHISCPEMELGKSYRITAGDQSEEITLDSVSVSAGESSGGRGFGGGGFGGFGGGRGGQRGWQGGTGSSDGTASGNAWDGGNGFPPPPGMEGFGGSDGTNGMGFPGPPDMGNWGGSDGAAFPGPPGMGGFGGSDGAMMGGFGGGGRGMGGPPGMWEEAESEKTEGSSSNQKPLSEMDTQTRPYLIFSVIALLAGLLFAFFFKRRH